MSLAGICARAEAKAAADPGGCSFWGDERSHRAHARAFPGRLRPETSSVPRCRGNSLRDEIGDASLFHDDHRATCGSAVAPGGEGSGRWGAPHQNPSLGAGSSRMDRSHFSPRPLREGGKIILGLEKRGRTMNPSRAMPGMRRCRVGFPASSWKPSSAQAEVCRGRSEAGPKGKGASRAAARARHHAVPAMGFRLRKAGWVDVISSRCSGGGEAPGFRASRRKPSRLCGEAVAERHHLRARPSRPGLESAGPGSYIAREDKIRCAPGPEELEHSGQAALAYSGACSFARRVTWIVVELVGEDVALFIVDEIYGAIADLSAQLWQGELGVHFPRGGQKSSPPLRGPKQHAIGWPGSATAHFLPGARRGEGSAVQRRLTSSRVGGTTPQRVREAVGRSAGHIGETTATKVKKPRAWPSARTKPCFQARKKAAATKAAPGRIRSDSIPRRKPMATCTTQRPITASPAQKTGVDSSKLMAWG